MSEIYTDQIMVRLPFVAEKSTSKTNTVRAYRVKIFSSNEEKKSV